MRHSGLLLLTCVLEMVWLTAGFTSSGTSVQRDLSDYKYMFYDRCLRVKIRENKDDDGNSYFYNGAYRSQSMLYLAYHLCEDTGCSGGGTAFLVKGDDVLKNNIQYTQAYCQACSSQCSQRRSLGGGGNNNNNNNNNNNKNQQQYQQKYYEPVPDCSTCANECRTLLTKKNEGKDETSYLDCQAAFTDEQGLQMYSRASCDNKGELTIGLFYDDGCTIKQNDNHDEYGKNFAKNTFISHEQMKMSCSDGVCDDVEKGFHCVDGHNINDYADDYMSVCKTYQKVSKEWIYATPPPEHPVLLFTFLSFLGASCILGSYVYYVQHKKAQDKLAEGLVDANVADPPPKVDYSVMS